MWHRYFHKAIGSASSSQFLNILFPFLKYFHVTVRAVERNLIDYEMHSLCFWILLISDRTRIHNNYGLVELIASKGAEDVLKKWLGCQSIVTGIVLKWYSKLVQWVQVNQETLDKVYKLWFSDRRVRHKSSKKPSLVILLWKFRLQLFKGATSSYENFHSNLCWICHHWTAVMLND